MVTSEELPNYCGMWKVSEKLRSPFFINLKQIGEKIGKKSINAGFDMQDRFGRLYFFGVLAHMDISLYCQRYTVIAKLENEIKDMIFEGRLQGYRYKGIVRIGKMEGTFEMEPFDEENPLEAELYRIYNCETWRLRSVGFDDLRAIKYVRRKLRLPVKGITFR